MRVLSSTFSTYSSGVTGDENGAYHGVGLGVNNIPHLGFSERMVTLHGKLIVGVNLKREVAYGVDNLYQQGEGGSETLEVRLAYQCGTIFLDHTGESKPGVRAVFNNRFIAFYAGYFPAFTYLLLVGHNTFEWRDFLAAPDSAFENGAKFQGWNVDIFHDTLYCYDYIANIRKYIVVKSFMRK